MTRRSTGSNFWGDANVRDWLNSESDKVEWTCKNPPTDKVVVDGNNAYSSEPGFLTGFTDAEKSLIKDTEQKTIVAGAEHENGIVDTGTEDLVWKAEIISERTLVPVRAISESAGCSVDWDGETQTVIINK